jgi:hypothetical protein
MKFSNHTEFCAPKADYLRIDGCCGLQLGLKEPTAVTERLRSDKKVGKIAYLPHEEKKQNVFKRIKH